MHRITLSIGLTAAVLATAAGCSGGSGDRGTAGGTRRATSGAPTVSAPFELRGVVGRVQTRFGDDGDGFSAAVSSYVARVSPSGVAEFTPRAMTVPPDEDDAAQAQGGTAPVTTGAPARISTVDIRRGASSLMSAGAPLRDADGALLIPRGEILERLESTARGLEQTWTFPRRPDGRGDLTVRIAVAGLASAGVTAGGLHFRDPATGLGVRYGTATWIDGVGHAAELPATLDGADVVITVPEELLERSAYPAVVDSLVSVELELDRDVTYWTTINAQITSNGTDFLVVWSDSPVGSSGARIVAARVNAQGAVLDPAGIVLTSTPIVYGGGVGVAGNPATGEYLVTWLEGMNYGQRTLSAATVSAAGGRTSAAPLPGFWSLGRPASSGTGFVVGAWMASPASFLAVRYESGGGALWGSVAGSVPMTLLNPAPTATQIGAPSVACRPSGACLMTWVIVENPTCVTGVGCTGGTMRVWGVELPPGGGPVNPALLADGGETEPGFVLRPGVVASDDAAPYLVLWPSKVGGIDRIFGLLVDADGWAPPVAAAATPSPVPLSDDGANPRAASAAFDGTNHVVVVSERRYGTNSTAYAMRVNPATAAVLPQVDPITGALLPDGLLQLSKPNEGSFAGAAWAPASGVGMVQWTPLTQSLVITRFWDAPTGLLIDRPGGVPIDVVVGHSATSPKADFDGDAYLVTWLDDRSGSQILGARVSQAGTVVDPHPALLVPLATIQSHALAFNGENHALVWVDSTDASVRLARLTPQLALLDPLGVVVGALGTDLSPAGNIRVAASGRDLLVLWAATNAATGLRELWMRRMTGDALPIDPAPVLAVPTFGSFSVTSDGDGWFVVYATPGSSPTVRGFRVAPSGAMSPQVALADTVAVQAYPTAVFDGTHYRAFWRDYRNASPGQFYSARFERDGSRTPGADVLMTVLPPGSGQSLAASTHDGQNAIVVIQESQGSTATLSAGWIASDGTKVGDTVGLAQGVLPGARVGVATNRAGTALVAYATTDPVTRLSRVTARLVTEGASLAVSRSGSGAGRVTSAPAGIDCGSACTAPFEAGTSVTLTADPEVGSVFAGWSGACTGTSTCTVQAGGAALVTAKFDRAPATGSFAVRVACAGTGPGRISPSGGGLPVACPAGAATEIGTFAAGTVLDLTATVDVGAHFTGWSGACRGSAAVCTVVVNGTVDLTGIFDLGDPLSWGSNAAPVQLLPGAGPVSGGTEVVVKGFGFQQGALVLFGGVAAPSVVVSPGGVMLTATTPPGVAGPVDVLISNPGGQSATLAAGFTYFDASSNTPTGQDVTVVPTSAPDVPLVQMHFDNVQTAGETTIVPLASAPPVPSSFFVVSAPTQPRFLEIQTAASYRGKIELAITYDPVAMGLSPAQERALRLIHFDGTRWEDATEVANPHQPPYGDADPHFFGRNSPPFLNPDTRTKTLYGVVTSFSPVALAVGGSTVDLNVAANGPGSGTIRGPGVDCHTGSGPCSAAFSSDGGAQIIELTAVPDPGSMLWSWAGACGGTGTCTVTMNGPRWVVAGFKPALNALRVVAYGGGTVTSTPAGIACREGATSGCAMNVANSNGPAPTVTLTASTDLGSVFKGWSAPCLGSTALTCVVPVGYPTLVTATFAPDRIPVTLSLPGDGHGSIRATATGGLDLTCASARGCPIDIPNTTPATSVTFQAAAASDSLFVGWGGICSGSAATCTVAIQGSGTVVAYFKPRTYPLTVATQGTGSGTIRGGAIDCSTGLVGTCSADVGNTSPATTLTLTATAAAGSTFAGWAGACVGTASCTVSMSSARHVIAQFDRASP